MSTDDEDRFGDHDRYETAIEQSIAFAHVGHEMFIEAKALALVDVVERRCGSAVGLDYLDVGCGVGAMQTYVAPVAERSVGIDTSAESIRAATDRHPDTTFQVYEGDRIPFEDATFDVTFAVNVVHHVEPEDRPGFAEELVRVTRPDGLVVVFEQNPINPLTRLAVARCAFDEGVVLTGRRGVERMMEGAGASVLERRYILFFPIEARWARSIEARLGWLPLGAQHMVASRPR